MGLAPAAASGGNSIVSSAMQGFAATLGKQIGRFTKPVVDRAIVDLGIGFQSYLEASYNRCRFFKTILNQAEPLEVAAYYVHNSLSCGSKNITDHDLISSTAKLKYVVVTGLAGSGKSMFMKYLTICKFENPQGQLPLFVELRQLNSLGTQDLLEFVRASCTGKGHHVTQDQFALALAAGAFTIILDGFDELNHEHRDEISKQILSLIQRYPDIPVIISSRQDDRFGGWAPFHVYTVDKLNKSQCLELISSLEYDTGVKRRFHREVKTRLFQTHESFLSSPLLTTIMLLTYEEFAEIPVKMHAFYSQAFDTLFQKHDASKEQYQRKIHTGLGREDFKSTFAAFCAMSYLDQSFSFEADQLIDTAESAIRYIKQAKTGIPRNVTAQNLIDDLKESVCLLQQDGLETAFVHRSFQEYFAAVFVTSLHGEKIRKVLDKYALRFGDSVISMAMDISRESIEQEWVLATLAELEDVLQLNVETVGSSERFRKLFERINLNRFQKAVYPTAYGIKTEVVGPLETICCLYPAQLGRALLVQPFSKNIENLREAYAADEHAGKDGADALKRFFGTKAKSAQDKVATFDLSQDHDWWMEIVGIPEMFSKMQRGFATIRRDIALRAKRRRDILEDFL